LATKREPESSVSLEAGEQALARGEWETARAIYDALVAERETAEAVEGQSWVAWWLDDGDVVFSARERAYHLYREAGDMLGAARMAIWLGNDYIDFYGEMAVSNGWIQIAQRTLSDLPTAPEHGFLAILQADLALMLEEDTVTSIQQAQRATAIGRQVGVPDIEVLGRTIEGLALVTEGDMVQGMSLLDEAATEAVSGSLADLSAVSFVLCHLIFACERSQDFERAAQWCHRTREYADRIGFSFAQGYCRVHYAGVLLWRGMWAEAEKELADASRYLRQSRPAWEPEAKVRLGELRRRQGRLEEAQALFQEVDWLPLASLGFAELALDSGRLQDAEEYAHRVLRAVPEKSVAQRAAGLDVLIRVLCAAGRPNDASPGLQEFDRIAGLVGTLPIRATATSLAGEVAVARGDHDAARQHFEDAIAVFERCGARYDGAKARLTLAGVLNRQGRLERARQEARAALEAFRSLGALADATMAAVILEGNGADTEAARSVLTSRQIEILRLVAEGKNDREIAAALVMSEHTVHRHVANILQRFGEPSRAAAVAHASRLGLL